MVALWRTRAVSGLPTSGRLITRVSAWVSFSTSHVDFTELLGCSHSCLSSNWGSFQSFYFPFSCLPPTILLPGLPQCVGWLLDHIARPLDSVHRPLVCPPSAAQSQEFLLSCLQVRGFFPLLLESTSESFPWSPVQLYFSALISFWFLFRLCVFLFHFVPTSFSRPSPHLPLVVCALLTIVVKSLSSRSASRCPGAAAVHVLSPVPVCLVRGHFSPTVW